MPVADTPELEQLAEPPIDEVVCGITFRTIPSLDLLVIGSYWKRRERDFPGRQMAPAVTEAVPTMFSLIPLRALLISRDDNYILQLQADRFYLNWRRRHGEYPRFNARPGKPGVLSRALEEFRYFSDFCREELRTEPACTGIELAKVDLFREGHSWEGLSDLAQMLPWLKDFTSFATSGTPSFSLRFDEQQERGNQTISLVLGNEQRPDEKPGRALRIETRIVMQAADASADAMQVLFVEANRELNRIFASLIPKTERDKRFNRGSE